VGPYKSLVEAIEDHAVVEDEEELEPEGAPCRGGSRARPVRLDRPRDVRAGRGWRAAPRGPLRSPRCLEGGARAKWRRRSSSAFVRRVLPASRGRVELIETHISWVLLAGDFRLQDQEARKASRLRRFLHARIAAGSSARRSCGSTAAPRRPLASRSSPSPAPPNPRRWAAGRAVRLRGADAAFPAGGASRSRGEVGRAHRWPGGSLRAVGGGLPRERSPRGRRRRVRFSAASRRGRRTTSRS